MAAFAGMRGTGSWVTDQRPKNFRQGLLYLYPNGTAPLTAINSMGRSRRVDDPEFAYFAKELEARQTTLSTSGLYTDSGLSAASTGSKAAGTTLYASMAGASDRDNYRAGQTIRLVDASNLTVNALAKVTSVGADHLVIDLLSVCNPSEDIDTVHVSGSVNEEGATIPASVSYDPTKFYNYTQIFRTPLDITRTAQLTRLRTGNPYKELKREALQYHGIDMEWAAFFGEKSENTGSGGHPERTTQGYISFINEHESGNVDDWQDEAGTWAAGGEDWLDDKFEQVFRYGRNEKTMFAGSGAILGINKLVKNTGQFNYTAKTSSYGINIVRWDGPFGVINIINHPLFTQSALYRHMCVIMEPENTQFSYITDTMFKPDPAQKEGGFSARDALKEEYLTEAGWEFQFAKTGMVLYSVGQD